MTCVPRLLLLGADGLLDVAYRRYPAHYDDVLDEVHEPHASPGPRHVAKRCDGRFEARPGWASSGNNRGCLQPGGGPCGATVRFLTLHDPVTDPLVARAGGAEGRLRRPRPGARQATAARTVDANRHHTWGRGYFTGRWRCS